MADKEFSWFDLTERELAENEEGRKARSRAYYNTFYATEEGRAVLFDLRRRIYEASGLDPVAVVALIEMYEYIRKSSSLDEKAVIDAEASTIIVE